MELEMRRPWFRQGIPTQCVRQTIFFWNYALVGSLLVEMIRLLPRSTKFVHHIAVPSGSRRGWSINPPQQVPIDDFP
jgi:hypothetical protein